MGNYKKRLAWPENQRYKNSGSGEINNLFSLLFRVKICNR
jgi:hypothetical protein